MQSSQREIQYVPKEVKKKGLSYYLKNPAEIKKSLRDWYFVSVHLRVSFYYHRVFSNNKRFNLNNKRYKYFIHRYNQTFFNERCVEIPIINEFIKEIGPGTILEVGNVLSHYFNYGHTVIDKFEKAKGVINVDAIDYKPSIKFDRIISISTIEHIGWDDHPRDDKKIPVAIAVLKSLLAPGGKLVVTAPMGYNPNLDTMIKGGILNFTEQYFLKRINAYGEWEEIKMDETTGAEYGKPFPCTNVLFVGIYEN